MRAIHAELVEGKEMRIAHIANLIAGYVDIASGLIAFSRRRSSI